MADKNPTNLDLLREIRGMNTRVTVLENWKIAEDAARKAVEEYRNREQADSRDKTWTGVAKQLIPLLMALTALVYAFAQGLTK